MSILLWKMGQHRKAVSREGHTGVHAKIRLPFVGFHFFNGDTYTFPKSTMAQDKKTLLGGITKPDTFRKEGGWVNGKS